MAFKILELFNIVLAAFVGGMYWGPWLALSRSLDTFEPPVFLAVVRRLNDNMAGLMTVLSPLSLAANVAAAVCFFVDNRMSAFYLTVAGLVLFAFAVVVTVTIEVPIVKQILTWTETTLPPDWEERRDKWRRNHLWRVAAGIAGLTLLIAAVLV